MDINIRIYTRNENGASNTRALLINEGELDDALRDYLRKEQYIKGDEHIETITYEGAKF